MTRNELIKKIRSADPNDFHQFHEILMTGSDMGLWNEKSLAHEFDTSYSTTRRWISGANAPLPAMRRAVYRTFIEKFQNSR